MFQFQLKHQAAPSSFWGAEETVKEEKPQPPSHTQNLLAAAVEALILLYSNSQNQNQANQHAEMKSTVDTVRGQEARNSAST